MSRINILDDHLTNMIAAGEVIERPMGVVKELVENSIDAKATKIEIRLVNGGLDSIEVSDDGWGMDPQDATRAFMRHATSKISQESDLWKISTMGFRGEALPSIAAVSKVKMTTCDGQKSTFVRIEYGNLMEAKPIAANQGTTIKVEGLLYKTPARLKHMKSGQTEGNLILETVQKQALAHPEIAFELYSDERLKLQTNGSNSLQETIMAIYGLEVAKRCIPLSYQNYDFEISGYLVSPVISRSSRQYINCCLNGRIIKSLPIQRAIIEGYRQFMMPDRYPIVVISIKADYQLIDVNVHPSKWEIRISKERDLYAMLTSGIHDTILAYMRPGEVSVEKALVQAAPQEDKEGETVYMTEENKTTSLALNEPAREAYTPYISSEKVKFDQPAFDDLPVINDSLQHQVEEQEVKTLVDRFQYLAQYHGKYILAFDENTLYIIDQHAAMERCRYEEIQNDILNSSVEVQPLLVPLVIDLTPVQMNQIDYINEMLQCINLKLEPFSTNSVLIREIPVFLEKEEEQTFILELIDEILADKQMSVLDIRKERIATMACHSSVRFNRYLTVEECKNLLARLSKCVQPFNCPHGRPTMISLTDAQLQKEFKRE